MSLKPKHFRQYRDIARLMMKYGRMDMLEHAALREALDNDTPLLDSSAPPAEELARDLEALGPTFIKLGQLLSTRADFIPASYVEALTRLQDNVAPFPFEEVEATVCAELGVRLSKAFSEFDREPIAAASLGQVHHAKLRDGRDVAVKVQRPHIRERISEDLDVLTELADFAHRHTAFGKRYDFPGALEEFRKALWQELDYRQEARNLQRLKENLADFERILIPAPVDDYTSSRVLTMDYIRGVKITSLSPLTKLELDGVGLAEELFQAYLQQILVDGFFHADPHPGNVFLSSDHRIVLLDLGMTAHLAPNLQEHLLKLLLAVSEGKGDEAARVVLRMGQRKEGFDEEKFRREVTDLVVRHQDMTVQDIQVGRVVLSVTEIASANGVKLPVEFTMLGKTLLNLDLIGRTLDPEFDPNAAIRENASSVMRRRMLKMFSPGNLGTAMLETNEFIQRLPGRMNAVFERLATNQIEFKVKSFDETRMLEGFQKVANRITVGLIIAALIIGAAMMMRVHTSFQILGYPAIAMILFLAAAAAGFWVIVDILLHDRHPRKKKPS